MTVSGVPDTDSCVCLTLMRVLLNQMRVCLRLFRVCLTLMRVLRTQMRVCLRLFWVCLTLMCVSLAGIWRGNPRTPIGLGVRASPSEGDQLGACTDVDQIALLSEVDQIGSPAQNDHRSGHP